MNFYHRKQTMLASAALGVALSLGAAGTANAGPTLSIVDAANVARVATDAQAEYTGDPGGSVYPWAGGPGAGAGIPWRNSTTGAGWAAGSGMGPDPSFPGYEGTSGWHNSYLRLSEAAAVTFQFMGAGNSSRANSFWVDTNGALAGGWTQLFRDGQSTSPTNPCPVSGNFPTCDQLAGGFPNQNQYTLNLQAGLIAFAFDVNGRVAGGVPQGPINDPNASWLFDDGRGNASTNCLGNPDVAQGAATDCAGYFLGADPYLVNAAHVSTGLQAVYAGLTDLPCAETGVCDHDFQDMGVRISVVPEPGGMALVLVAFGGLAWAQRRHNRL